MSDHNRLRSIGQLAVVGGWYESDESEPNRHTLHLSATFKEERLGGVDSSNIHFRIRLKQCEIVVLVPERGVGFSVLEKSIARTPPAPPLAVTDKRTVQEEIGLDGQVGIGKAGIFARVIGSSKKNTRTERGIDGSYVGPRMEVLHSKTHELHNSWIVRAVGVGLSGALWDPIREPRFSLVDKRTGDEIQKSQARGLPPMTVVEVRCKREDIDIFDIEFKDLKRDRIEQGRENQEIRMRAAEAFLKSQIQIQGLRVGDVRDKFSDVTLAEYLIPLFE